MKKKKLNLEQIRVKSFVTQFDTMKERTVRGGFRIEEEDTGDGGDDGTGFSCDITNATCNVSWPNEC